MMRRIIAVVAVVAVAAAWTMGRPTPAASEDGIAVYFSPNGGCTEAIIDQIGNAQETVLVQAYSFTSAPIAKALLDAHKRGVFVHVVLDSSQRTARYSSATFFRNQGIPVLIDSEHAIAHNKVMVIDGETIITGSFNFSKAAEERNTENLLIITGKPRLTRAYLDNIREHFVHSEVYAGPAQEPDEPAATVGTVYVTPNGKKYHRAGCRYVRDTATKQSVKDAKAAGLSPCKVCKPGG